MALTHLLDTSVLTRLNHPTIRSAVEPLAATGQAARAGISDLEIGFSARNATEWDQLTSALTVFDLVESLADYGADYRNFARELLLHLRELLLVKLAPEDSTVKRNLLTLERLGY